VAINIDVPNTTLSNKTSNIVDLKCRRDSITCVDRSTFRRLLDEEIKINLKKLKDYFLNSLENALIPCT
jgi:hypothetical protein